MKLFPGRTQYFPGGAPMTWSQIVINEIRLFQSGPRCQWMKTAQRYYDGHHDILDQPRYVVGEDGRRCPAENVADNRLVHGFLRELVDQKTQYLLGLPFSVAAPDEFAQVLHQVLDASFANTLRRVAKDAINKGVGWLHPYVDEGGQLCFKRCCPEEMTPIWKDMEHTQLEAMIRMYEVVFYEGARQTTQKKVTVWRKSSVEHYVLRSGELYPDQDAPQAAPLLWCDEQGQSPFNWKEIPFIPVKYNDEEWPLIAYVKSLIDDYDRVASNNSNLLEDQPNSILVVRNYDGQKLGEFRRNLAAYRAVKVTGDGGVEALNSPINTEAANAHLERLRQDIYAFGRGVDLRNQHFGSAVSGIALRQAYAGLDLDCNGLEVHLKDALTKLLTFIKAFLLAQDAGDFRGCGAEFVFNRDIVIHEEAAVSMCQASQDLLSQETVLANHPWVRDVVREKARIDQEKEGIHEEIR